MAVYERVSAVVSMTLIGLALYFVLEFPRQTATVMLFGSPLSLNMPRQWLMAGLLAGLAMAGANTVVRSHPDLPAPRLSYLATFWMLPGLIVFLATQTLGLAPNVVAWAGALIGGGILLWLTIVAEFHQVMAGVKVAKPGGARHSPSVRDRPAFVNWSRLWHQLVSYGLALALFLFIYHPRSRSALSATSVSLVSTMIALSVLRTAPTAISKTWLFAAIVGLSMGQITWALNYWRVTTLHAGLLLLLIFYIFVGLAYQQLQNTLSRRTLYEFGTVTIIALLLLLYL